MRTRLGQIPPELRNLVASCVVLDAKRREEQAALQLFAGADNILALRDVRTYQA